MHYPSNNTHRLSRVPNLPSYGTRSLQQSNKESLYDIHPEIHSFVRVVYSLDLGYIYRKVFSKDSECNPGHDKQSYKNCQRK